MAFGFELAAVQCVGCHRVIVVDFDVFDLIFGIVLVHADHAAQFEVVAVFPDRDDFAARNGFERQIPGFVVIDLQPGNGAQNHIGTQAAQAPHECPVKDRVQVFGVLFVVAVNRQLFGQKIVHLLIHELRKKWMCNL